MEGEDKSSEIKAEKGPEQQPEDKAEHKPEQKAEQKADKGPWWKVMCLTGADYFSTLGYQPGIAYKCDGETATVTREILREAESDQKKRPKVHVG